MYGCKIKILTLMMIYFIGTSNVWAGYVTKLEIIQSICNIDNKLSGVERQKRLADLPKQLSDEAVDIFYEFICSTAKPTNMDSSQYYYLKNNILNKISLMPLKPKDFELLLVKLYTDSQQDIILRDYALQFMASFYSRASDQSAIQDTLLEACQQRNSMIAGTALHSIHRIREEDVESFDLKFIQRLIREVIEDPKTCLSTRITAVKLGGLWIGSSFYETAFDIANDQSSPPVLRIAAISTLGDIGDKQSEIFLESLVVPGTRYNLPAKKALRLIQEKN